MILLIDNYDSFSYNLYQLIGTIEPDLKVIRNDMLTIPDIEALAPQAIFLSPVRADRPTRGSVWMRYPISRGKFRSSAYVSAIRPSVKRSAQRSLMRPI